MYLTSAKIFYVSWSLPFFISIPIKYLFRLCQCTHQIWFVFLNVIHFQEDHQKKACQQLICLTSKPIYLFIFFTLYSLSMVTWGCQRGRGRVHSGQVALSWRFLELSVYLWLTLCFLLLQFFLQCFKLWCLFLKKVCIY